MEQNGTIVHVDLTEAAFRELRELADENDQSVDEAIRDAVRERLGR